jgi:hypothetical protein
MTNILAEVYKGTTFGLKSQRSINLFGSGDFPKSPEV